MGFRVLEAYKLACCAVPIVVQQTGNREPNFGASKMEPKMEYLQSSPDCAVMAVQ